jgi:ABC-type branched-subunit amino acid transport system ATPase component/branched-subunit amino acid ABC-type transport system permease component
VLLPFIIAGLTTGSVYALAGVGLVLTYKTSGVFNFAHGALATVSAYLFYSLQVQAGIPWPAAAAVCVLGVGPILGLLLERISRTLVLSSLATRVVSTVGILLVIQALVVIIYGETITRAVPPYLPTHAFTVGGATVTSDRILVFGIAAAATAALYVYFRVTRMGVAMRAVVDNSVLLDVAGTSPVAVRRIAWIIGSMMASASGLLLAPFITLDATNLTFLVVTAYGAAALGRFTNIPATYFGGLALGVAAAVCTKYFTAGLLSGLAASLPFLVLFVVLLLTPKSKLADRATIVPRNRAAWTTPWQVQVFFGLALLVALVLVPQFAGYHLADYSTFLGATVLFLSLGLLVRTSGQVSLCHVSFMAIGVCAFSHLAVDRHWPWGPALVTAGLIAAPIGALLAVPAIRLSGLYLALATFGFGILLQFMFYTSDFMFGDLALGIDVPKPVIPALGLDGSDKSYYYLCLVIAVVVVAAVIGINRSRLGRLLRALSDSSVGLAASGASINVTRLLVFCASAFLAAIAGVLMAGAIGHVDSASYMPITSLMYFALIIITVGGAPWYAVVAAAGFVVIPSYLTSSNTMNWLQVVFGASAVLFAMTPESMREGSHFIQDGLDRLFRRTARSRPEPVDVQRLELVEKPPSRERTLQVEDLRVAFGGLVAVDGASLEVPRGRITGLIGPNGAGKTTIFNACSGLNRPSRGSIRLDGVEISRRGTASRARRGMGRTFQQMELFDSLTVWENVALGAEAGRAGVNFLQHLMSSPATKRRIRARTEIALKQCDLLDLADRIVGSLSTGQRRLVELARCLSGPFHVLLLDEPSSGLDRVESAKFGQILRNVVAEHGVGILLVEHDITLVAEVCDYIYVLDFGKPIFQGTVSDVLVSPLVRAAYLGTDEVERMVGEVKAHTGTEEAG